MSDEWAETTLGEVASWGAGGTPKAGEPIYYEGGTFPWAVIADVQDGPLEDTEKHLTPAGVAKIGHTAPKDAVLVTMYGTVGRVAIARREMATNQAIAWGVVQPDHISPEFLFQWLRNHQPTLDLLARGATQRNINRAILKAQTLALPPLSVQRRIVDLVEHLDAHITNLKIEQEALATGHSALRQEILGAWDYEELSSFATIEAALVDPRKPDYQALGHVGVDRIEKGTGRLLPLQTAREEALISAKYLFGPLDVIYAKIRPNLRKVAYPGFSGLCSADAYPLRPLDGLPPRLLMEAMLMPDVVETVVAKSGRTKMPKVNRKELFTVEVPLRASEPAEWVTAEQILADSALAVDALDNEVMSLVSVRSALLSALLSREVEIPASYDDLLDGVA